MHFREPINEYMVCTVQYSPSPPFTDKKGNTIFLIYWEISNGIGCKVIYEGGLPNMWWNAQIFHYLEAESHIWLCTRSLWISLYMRKLFISVPHETFTPVDVFRFQNLYSQIRPSWTIHQKLIGDRNNNLFNVHIWLNIVKFPYTYTGNEVLDE